VPVQAQVHADASAEVLLKTEAPVEDVVPL